jgi:hypothetical protein
MFVRLGGLMNSKIIYDPEEKITDYKKSIRVSKTIRRVYVKSIKKHLEWDLHAIQVASNRGGIVNYLGYLYDIVEKLSAVIWLTEGKFPDSLKRYEVTEENDLTELLKRLEAKVDKDRITKDLIKISKSYGFTPSKTPRA